MLEVKNNYYLIADEYGTPELKISNLLRAFSSCPQKLGEGYKEVGLGLFTDEPQLSFLDFYLKQGEKLIIGEIRNYPVLNLDVATSIQEELKVSMQEANAQEAILIVPSIVSTEIQDYLKQHNIIVWDIEDIQVIEEIRNNLIKETVPIQQLAHA
ncbi:MAG: hypothetical protein HC836_38270 [Richelia sp. RM2_1_2]|nr:hypothetical protein [Richelia sp. RM1_1_1]NJO63825.1 hypothetical protein [Richelia sp. RM2_1_2]